MDYYFSKDLGLLTAEKLHLYRYDHPTSYESPKKHEETLVIYKTLARVNLDVILDFQEPISPWIVTTIVMLPIIFVSLILLLKRKVIFRTDLKKE